MIPSQDEVLSWFDVLSNWGRWGADDRLGTLNHLTPERRRAALASVRQGRTVSLAWDIDPDRAEGNVLPPQRLVRASGEPDDVSDGPVHGMLRAGGIGTDRASFVMDEFRLSYHGTHVTHVDSIAHAFWDGMLFNGVPASTATRSGATEHDVVGSAGGVVGRGVLLDAARYRGARWLDPGDGVGARELDAIAAAEGAEIGPGDVVLLRTGYGRRRREDPAGWRPQESYPGWQASALPWLFQNGVAAIGADTAQESLPSGYPEVPMPVHYVGIVAMGLCLVDNCDLEALAAACEQAGHWDFLFMLAPLRLVGLSGSPANPLAII
jgi:kynurenine formamidase